MKPIKILNKLYMLKYPDQFTLTSTFMRLQEFYESPYKTIRNKHFSWDEMFKKYVKNNTFTYFSDWTGFNVPGVVIIQFFYVFGDELLKKEKALYNTIKSLISKHSNDFYLIGVFQNEDIKHEVAHGLYYLDRVYRTKMKNLIRQIDAKKLNELCLNLADKGYCKEVFMDEIQAYAIDDNDEKFISVFNEYYKRD